jgi:hypothetical protein
MIKNTRSVTVEKVSTVLYDTNGRIVSQVKEKRVTKSKGEEIDRSVSVMDQILNTYLDDKTSLKKPVLRDQVHIRDLFKD